MVALAQMVSMDILVRVLVATLAQHVRQVRIIYDVKIKAVKISSSFQVQDSHFLTTVKGMILIC